MYVLYMLYVRTTRIPRIPRIISCDLSCDLGYHSSSYGSIGSIVACATSTNSLSSALSSCDTCLIRSVTAMTLTEIYITLRIPSRVQRINYNSCTCSRRKSLPFGRWRRPCLTPVRSKALMSLIKDCWAAATRALILVVSSPATRQCLA